MLGPNMQHHDQCIKQQHSGGRNLLQQLPMLGTFLQQFQHIRTWYFIYCERHLQ